ncbi:MAG: hypothetical protein ACK4OO_07765, partial [bacterium]
VEIQDVNIVLLEGSLDDNEIGNGDGMLQNGESGYLNLTFINDGPEDAQNITASFSSDTPLLNIRPQQARLENIPSGESGTLIDEVTLSLDPSTPGRTLIRLQINLSNGQEAAYEFTTSGPKIAWNGDVQSFNLNRGSQGTIAFRLINLGDQSIGAIEAQLVSLHPHIRVREDRRTYPPLEPEESAFPQNPFLVAIDTLFIPGQVAPFEIHIQTEDNFRSSISAEIPIGESSPSDPIGPDSYGYYAFDSGDTTWYQAPIYRWREINYDAGNSEIRGERINFTQIRGESVITALPFTFRYYGQDYDSLVICSNGWVSFDPQALNYSSTNYQLIEGGGAPAAQLAPFWRSLEIPRHNFWGIFIGYLEEEHIFVIEWSNVEVIHQDRIYPVDFQILLFDPTFWTTSTGDGEIVFQYRRFNEVPGNLN